MPESVGHAVHRNTELLKLALVDFEQRRVRTVLQETLVSRIAMLLHLSFELAQRLHLTPDEVGLELAGERGQRFVVAGRNCVVQVLDVLV